mmetsp:Transcript_26839/g.69213  ORF Transcript_26839/g.69213 Transcript_26839/m.69213 type:complete len:135 (+) Transcript_26839:392-796(+)
MCGPATPPTEECRHSKTLPTLIKEKVTHWIKRAINPLPLQKWSSFKDSFLARFNDSTASTTHGNTKLSVKHSTVFRFEGCIQVPPNKGAAGNSTPRLLKKAKAKRRERFAPHGWHPPFSILSHSFFYTVALGLR